MKSRTVAFEWIAIPLLAAERFNRRIGVGIIRSKGNLIRQNIPTAVDRPKPSMSQRVALRPQSYGTDRARWAVSVDSSVGPVGGSSMGAVLPRIQHVSSARFPKPDGGRAGATARQELMLRAAACARSRLDTLAHGAPRSGWLSAGPRILRDESCVVVFRLMVVPRNDPGERRVHRAQIRILFIEGVAYPVVIDRRDLMGRQMRTLNDAVRRPFVM